MTDPTLSVDPRLPFDLETRTLAHDHEALRLWLRLLTCVNLIEADVRGQLRADFDCTLPRFDLLAQLDRNPDGLKMGELSKRMMVTGGNVTGITDQLQKEGMVVRETLATDRRAYLIKLTPRGKKAFAKMAKAHEQWIESLFSRLPPQARAQMFTMLGELKHGLLAQRADPSNGAARAPEAAS